MIYLRLISQIAISRADDRHDDLEILVKSRVVEKNEISITLFNDYI